MAAAAQSPAQQARDAEEMVVLNETERVTKAELATIMGVNKDWPYPGHVDPWCVVHESITKDMKDTASALASIMAGLKAGKPLEAWQVSNLKKYIPVFIDFVHHHHDTEEKIVFPWINTRTNLGERMAADHKTLMMMLDRIEAGTRGLTVTGSADADMKAIEAIKQVMDEMLPEMTEHFKEEEERGLPLLRKHFTYKELLVVEEKIKATLTTKDMAHLLNPMLKPEEKRKFMSQLGVPGLIQSLVMMPACKKYQKKVQRLVEELQAGERTKPTGCFA